MKASAGLAFYGAFGFSMSFASGMTMTPPTFPRTYRLDEIRLDEIAGDRANLSEWVTGLLNSLTDCGLILQCECGGFTLATILKPTLAIEGYDRNFRFFDRTVTPPEDYRNYKPPVF